MFNNLTKTCSGADATWEILPMLAGAFLLGCLLCWLIRKLRGLDNPPEKGNRNHEHDNTHKNQLYQDSKKTTGSQTYQNTHKASLQGSASASASREEKTNGLQQAHQSYTVRKLGETNQSDYSTPRIDDLTKISSIDKKVESVLRGKGIKSYIDLRDASHEKLYSIMDTPDFDIPKNEVETWPHQSSLAAKGEWKKLSDYQSFKERSRNVTARTKSGSKRPGTSTTSKAESVASSSLHIKDTRDSKEKTDSSVNQDNPTGDNIEKDTLTKIAGITPDVEKTLNKQGIYTYSQLHQADDDTLKNYLASHNQGAKSIDADSLLQQAELAKDGKWDELEEYQDYLTIKRSNLSSNTASTLSSGSSNDFSSNDKIVNISDNKTHDDLQKIEGIGPKIEEVLNDNGIKTFEQLHKSNRNTLKSFLDKAGPQFKMHEPESWPHQAGMAYRGEWDKLKEYQDFMVGGRDDSISLTKSHKESLSNDLDDGIDNNDDLTKIEGIGPKIKEVLNSHGIYTFEQLHKTTRNTLKNYLNAAGPQFKMHEPESWPHQAGMANRGEWDKLKEYQDFMVGGRDDIMSLSSASDKSLQKNDSNNNEASTTTDYVDDLTKIEGIGPKIEQLLNEAGILNFAQLKSASRDAIKAILDNGGPQFKMHEPKSWPEQADLADRGEWKKLEELQDILIGGR